MISHLPFGEKELMKALERILYSTVSKFQKIICDFSFSKKL